MANNLPPDFFRHAECLHHCAAMPLRRCTVDLPILKREELPTIVEEETAISISVSTTHQPTSPTTTPRRSSRTTKGEGWPEQIRKFFSEKTPKKDSNEDGSVCHQECSETLVVEEELMEGMLKNAKLVESRVLSALRSQKNRIEELNKDLQNRDDRAGALEHENIKRKEQVLKMKSLIQPLRDEVVRQKTAVEDNLVEISKKDKKIATMNEEMALKERQFEEQAKLIASLTLQVKEARQTNDEEHLEIGAEWAEIVEEKRKLKHEKGELEAAREANKAKVRELESKVKEMSSMEQGCIFFSKI